MDPWKFEDNFANVCYAGLAARGIPHGETRGDEQNPQELVLVTASAFARASAQMARSNSGTWFHNHRTGQLAFAVVTQVNGQHAANHNVWVANIREMLERPAQFFTADNLPCYTILRVEETADALAQVPPHDAHRTTLAFAVEFAVNGAAVA